MSDAGHSASDRRTSHTRPDSERACDGFQNGDAGGPVMGVDDETDEMEQDSVDNVVGDTPDEGVSE